MSYDPRWSWGLTPSSPKPVRQGRADPARESEPRHDGGEADRVGVLTPKPGRKARRPAHRHPRSPTWRRGWLVVGQVAEAKLGERERAGGRSGEGLRTKR